MRLNTDFQIVVVLFGKGLSAYSKLHPLPFFRTRQKTEAIQDRLYVTKLILASRHFNRLASKSDHPILARRNPAFQLSF